MRLVGFVALLLLGTLSHALVGMWALRTFPSLAKRRRLVWAVVALFVVLPFATRILSRWTHGLLAPVYAFATTEYLAVLLAILPLMFGRIALDLGYRKKRPLLPQIVEVPGVTRRQVIEGVYGGAVLATTNGVLGWGAARGRHAFVIEELPVKIAGLPRALDGYTIAQISDLHVGAVVQERELDEGLDRLREVRPDLIVLTGDLVDFDPSFIPLMARKIGALRARDGTFAILGNHDYYTGASEVAAGLREAGVGVLVNQSHVVRDGFALLGVDDQWAPRLGGVGARLDLALKGLAPELPRILLSHQPDSVERWAGQVALQLSGHTHGGQINPGFRPIDFLTPYVAGRYDVRGTTLWVNRGFGVAGPPARVGSAPEVTKIVLVAV
jgi:predicted MPP superfamily phosphohydrolase